MLQSDVLLAGGAASGLSRDPSIPSSPASRPPWDNSFAGQAPDPALVQDQAPGQAPTLDHGQAPVTYIPPTGPFAANFTQSRDTVPHSVLTEILKPLPSQPSTRGYDILSGASSASSLGKFLQCAIPAVKISATGVEHLANICFV